MKYYYLCIIYNISVCPFPGILAKTKPQGTKKEAALRSGNDDSQEFCWYNTKPQVNNLKNEEASTSTQRSLDQEEKDEYPSF